MNEVRVTVNGDTAAEESLLDWLRKEPTLRGRVFRVTPPPQPGTMGSLSELVVESVVTGTIGTLTGLLGQLLSTWLGQRHSQGIVHTSVTLTTGDGRNVTVTSSQAAQVERLLRVALAGQSAPDVVPPAAAGDAQGR
ncbi:effector-associated constant component EACC1 [Streptomyces sp. NPDC001177]